MFQRRGFFTTKDVCDAGKGGMKNLAEEIDVNFPDELEVSKEIEATYYSVSGVEVVWKLEQFRP